MIANIVKVMPRRWSLILVTFLLGIGLVVYVQKFVPTTFLGTSTVLTINENSDRSLAGDVPLFIGSSDFLGRVARKVGSDEPLAAIQRSVKVKTKREALLIIYESPDPQRAVTMTNAIADELPLYYRSVVSQRFEHNVAALRGSVREQRNRMAAVNARLAEVTAGDAFSGGEKPLDQVSTRLGALQQVDASAGDAQRESSRSAPAGSSGFVEVPLASGEGAALSRDIVHATLRQLRLEFDFVIVDADPISNNGISLPICTVADGVIITGRAERPKRAVDHQLAKLLGVADATVLGVTLVGAETIAEHRERRHAVLSHGELAAPGGLRPQDVSDVVGA